MTSTDLQGQSLDLRPHGLHEFRIRSRTRNHFAIRAGYVALTLSGSTWYDMTGGEGARRDIAVATKYNDGLHICRNGLRGSGGRGTVSGTGEQAGPTQNRKMPIKLYSRFQRSTSGMIIIPFPRPDNLKTSRLAGNQKILPPWLPPKNQKPPNPPSPSLPVSLSSSSRENTLSDTNPP